MAIKSNTTKSKSNKLGAAATHPHANATPSAMAPYPITSAPVTPTLAFPLDPEFNAGPGMMLVDYGLSIIVVNNAFVYMGHAYQLKAQPGAVLTPAQAKMSDYICIKHAAVVYRSGINNGYGELAFAGMQPETVLHYNPPVYVPMHAVVHMMKLNDAVWGDYEQRAAAAYTAPTNKIPPALRLCEDGSIDFGYCLAVMDNSFLYFGHVVQYDGFYGLYNAANMRASGVQNGPGELCFNGPASGTTLDSCLPILCPTMRMCHIIRTSVVWGSPT